MKMRKILSAMLAAVCVCMLTACGSDSGNNGGSGDSEKEETKKIEVTKPEDLADLTIGVQQGTTGDLACSDIVKADSQMKRYPKGAAAVQALEAGKLDCVVIDAQPASKFVEKSDDLEIINGIFDDEQYAICIKKGNTELVDKMNGALGGLKDDGTLDKIIANYIGDNTGSFQYETPDGTDHSNGELVMATNAEFEPYEYHEGDEIIGIDVDIARAICDKLGYELKIEDMEFDSILPAVEAGKADFGAAGMTVTDERKENADFTDTYTNATQVVIIKK